MAAPYRLHCAGDDHLENIDIDNISGSEDEESEESMGHGSTIAPLNALRIPAPSRPQAFIAAHPVLAINSGAGVRPAYAPPRSVGSSHTGHSVVVPPRLQATHTGPALHSGYIAHPNAALQRQGAPLPAHPGGIARRIVSAPPVTVEEVSKVLHETQARLQQLEAHNNTLQAQNQALHEAAPAGNTRPADLPAELINSEKDIKKAGSKYATLDSPWIPDSVWGRPFHIDVDPFNYMQRYCPPDPRLIGDALADAHAAEVMRHFDKKYWRFLKNPWLQTTFSNAVSVRKSHIVNYLRTQRQAIFSHLDMSPAVFTSLERMKEDTLCAFWRGAPGEEEPPILFPPNKHLQIRFVFRNEAIAKIIQIMYFGEQAIHANYHYKGSSFGKKNKFTSISLGSIAIAAVLARYLLGYDATFQEDGEASKTPYLKWKDTYTMKLIQYRDSPYIHATIEWLEEKVFGPRARTSTPDVTGDVSADSAPRIRWDDLLVVDNEGLDTQNTNGLRTEMPADNVLSASPGLPPPGLYHDDLPTIPHHTASHQVRDRAVRRPPTVQTSAHGIVTPTGEYRHVENYAIQESAVPQAGSLEQLASTLGDISLSASPETHQLQPDVHAIALPVAPDLVIAGAMHAAGLDADHRMDLSHGLGLGEAPVHPQMALNLVEPAITRPARHRADAAPSAEDTTSAPKVVETTATRRTTRKRGAARGHA